MRPQRESPRLMNIFHNSIPRMFSCYYIYNIYIIDAIVYGDHTPLHESCTCIMNQALSDQHIRMESFKPSLHRVIFHLISCPAGKSLEHHRKPRLQYTTSCCKIMSSPLHWFEIPHVGFATKSLCRNFEFEIQGSHNGIAGNLGCSTCEFNPGSIFDMSGLPPSHCA